MGRILIYGSDTEPVSMDLADERDTRTLAQIIWTDGRFAPPPLCSGLGRCGRCRVQFMESEHAPQVDASEAQILGAEAVSQGWRLACRHKGPVGVDKDTVWKLFVPTQPRKKRKVPSIFQEKTTQACLLAVDLGTTSLHWEAILPTGETVATASMLNPQMGAGSDVMSRIAYAMNDAGRQTLRRLVVESLQGVQQELLMQGFHITELCIAGNTAMTAIVADVSVETLAAAPYAVPCAGNTYIDLFLENSPLGSSENRTLAFLENSAHSHLENSEFLPLTPAWIPPQVAPFIGGDLSAGYVALCQEYAPNYPFLLADLGTNGEFVLALSPEKSIITSVPLGPALEGIGLRYGAVAAAGVITKFSLGPMGLVASHLPNDDGTQAISQHSISGTGYLSLISTLLRAGILDEHGRFVQSAFGSGAGVLSPLAMRIAKTVYRVASPEATGINGGTNDVPSQNTQDGGELRLPLLPLPTGRGFSSPQARIHAPSFMGVASAKQAQSADKDAECSLSGGDIEEILKVKAAFSLAVAALLKAASLPANALDRIYIAGALGLHIMPHDLEGLGFLPTGSEKRITAVGNTSLKGAKAFLLDHEQRKVAQHWASTCTVLDLTQNHEDFTQSFLHHMRFRF